MGLIIPGTYWIWYLQARKCPQDWRALIQVYLLVTLLSYVWFEAVSALQWLSFSSITLFWLASGGLGFFLWLRRRRTHSSGTDRSSKLTYCMLFFLFSSFVAGCLFAPNNWDGIVYHMPRVLLWIQNHGIDVRVAHDARQIAYGPLAEVFIAQFLLLSHGSDIFAFAPQWMSFALSVLFVCWYLRDRFGQTEAVLGLFFVVSTPLLLLQSHSVQNDLFLGAFVLIGTVVVVEAPFSLLQNAILLWSTAALAFLTKGTGFIYFAPILIVHLAKFVHRRSKHRWGYLLWMAAPLLVTVPWLWRNWSAFGHPLGPAGITRDLAVGTFSLTGAVANAIRNFSLHLATPIPIVNDFLEQGVRGVVAFLGEDISSRNWIHKGSWRFPKFVLDEDEGGNLLHSLILIAALFFIWINRDPKSKKPLGMFCLIWSAQVILFFGLLKWQFWNGRLHTPLFLNGALLVAISFGEIGRARPWILRSFILVVTGLWAVVIWSNTMRPLSQAMSVDRERSYFQMAPDHYEDYDGLTKEILATGCRSVQVQWGREVFEYPLRYFVFRVNPEVKFFDRALDGVPCLWLRIGRRRETEDSNDMLGQGAKVLWKSSRAELYE